MKFRLLEASEIDCRVATISAKGVSLLLYKDARVDQAILDETVGPLNWQRSHSRDNANCTVSIWDEVKMQWVSKEDTGKESYTEAEKGLASDSFKRACFNWGIGRELYSAPFIWVNATDANVVNENGKQKCYERFSVSDIGYDEKKNINKLVIKNSQGKTVFTKGIAAKKEDKITQHQLGTIAAEMLRTGIDEKSVCERYKVSRLEELSYKDAEKAISALGKSHGNNS